jgi:hypothetical protein
MLPPPLLAERVAPRREGRSSRSLHDFDDQRDLPGQLVLRETGVDSMTDAAIGAG